MMKNCLERVRQFWRDESGMGTLEILLILAVIVLVAVVFRKWIINWVNGLLESTQDQMKEFNEQNSLTTPNGSETN